MKIGGCGRTLQWRLFGVPADTEGVEAGRMEEDQRPWRLHLSNPVQAVHGEGTVSTEPVAVDAVVAVSHGAHQQLSQQRLHKHADICGHDHSQGDVFKRGGAFC